MDRLDECCSVIFHDVKDYYSSDAAIICQFSVKENNAIDDSTNCFVGIFIVGWDFLESTVAKKDLSLTEFNDIGGVYTLSFGPDETPSSSSGEYYQFCFCNIKTKRVFGASCPFQICNMTDEQTNKNGQTLLDLSNSTAYFTSKIDNGMNLWLMEKEKTVEEDLDDTVLIHNKTTMMETALTNAAKDREKAVMITKLKFENDLKQFSSDKEEMLEKYNIEMNALKEENRLLIDNDTLLNQKITASEKVVEELSLRIKEMECNLESSRDLEKVLRQEKELLTALLKEKEASNAEEINKMKELIRLKQEKWDVKFNNMSNALIAEREKSERVEFECEELISSSKKEMERIAKKEEESNRNAQALIELEIKLKGEMNQNYDLLEEIDKLTLRISNLMEDNKKKGTLLEAEQNKLSLLLIQLQETDSQLKSEKEYEAFEIKRLKYIIEEMKASNQQESLCFKEQILEMKSLMKEKEEKSNSYVHELNENMQQIYELEMTLAEKEKFVQELTKIQEQINLESSNTVDKLKEKLVHHEEKNAKLMEEIECNTSCKTNEGSKYAFQVANNHMKQQLNDLKKEKEKLYHQQKSQEDISDLEKENEELKLRLCMGKKELEKRFLETQSLKKELKKTKQLLCTTSEETAETQVIQLQKQGKSLCTRSEKSILENTKIVDDLKLENENLHRKLVVVNEHLHKVKIEKEQAVNLHEELKLKCQLLVNQYEGKIHLLEKENGALKQRRAPFTQDKSETQHSSPDLVQTIGSSLACDQPNLIDRGTRPESKFPNENSIERKENLRYAGRRRCDEVVEHQPTHVAPPAIHHPPKLRTEQGCQNSQAATSHIIYPPSMRGMELRDQPQKIIRNPEGKGSTASHGKESMIDAEPPSQIMRSRDQSKVESHGVERIDVLCGRTADDSPTRKCPVCENDFPLNLTEQGKMDHVNGHFD